MKVGAAARREAASARGLQALLGWLMAHAPAPVFRARSGAPALQAPQSELLGHAVRMDLSDSVLTINKGGRILVGKSITVTASAPSCYLVLAGRGCRGMK